MINKKFGMEYGCAGVIGICKVFIAYLAAEKATGKEHCHHN
jgi:hypothetical protein